MSTGRTWGRLALAAQGFELRDRQPDGWGHLNLPRFKVTTVRRIATCPETGYRYGSKWLVDPLPDEVRDRFVALMSRGEEQETDY